MLSKVNMLINIYDFIFGLNDAVQDLVLDYNDVIKKLNGKIEGGKNEKSFMNATKQIIVKLNDEVSRIVKKNKIMNYTHSRALKEFIGNHSVDIGIVMKLSSILIDDIPKHIIMDGDFEVNLEAIFEEIESKKNEINDSLREAIVNCVVNDKIPEWITLFVKINYLVNEENRELLNNVKKRLSILNGNVMVS